MNRYGGSAVGSDGKGVVSGQFGKAGIGPHSMFTEAGSSSFCNAYWQQLTLLQEVKAIENSFADLKTATQNFKSNSVLGIGGFGTVFKGWVDEKTLEPTKFGTGMTVAIKKLNSESVQGFQEWQIMCPECPM
ncbi:hypothetical protein RHGRI_022592 [Rhododendron griersonianum]|uniref:Uncharacterized protein n=1 Tax=Rhododendron griersonianum TaxID=479676 RepID=A0AAV6J275_9ERIC|nr:hypothetical protein RHGRI_022592 [Rhododendron griersonianum]